MNEYAKMVEQAETENEKIFWKHFSQFLVSKVKVTIKRLGAFGSQVYLDGVPYVMFLDFCSKDEIEALAYATAQATNVMAACKLLVLKELSEYQIEEEDIEK